MSKQTHIFASYEFILVRTLSNEHTVIKNKNVQFDPPDWRMEMYHNEQKLVVVGLTQIMKATQNILRLGKHLQELSIF